MFSSLLWQPSLASAESLFPCVLRYAHVPNVLVQHSKWCEAVAWC